MWATPTCEQQPNNHRCLLTYPRLTYLVVESYLWGRLPWIGGFLWVTFFLLPAVRSSPPFIHLVSSFAAAAAAFPDRTPASPPSQSSEAGRRNQSWPYTGAPAAARISTSAPPTCTQRTRRSRPVTRARSPSPGSTTPLSALPRRTGSSPSSRPPTTGASCAGAPASTATPAATSSATSTRTACRRCAAPARTSRAPPGTDSRSRPSIYLPIEFLETFLPAHKNGILKIKTYRESADSRLG